MKHVKVGGAAIVLAIGIAAFPAGTPVLALNAPGNVEFSAAPMRSEAPAATPEWNIAENILTIGPGTFTFAPGDSIPWSKSLWNVDKIIFTDPTHTAIVGTPRYMFSAANVRTIEGINDVDVSGVTDMGFMFASTRKLESLDISDWDVSNVVNADQMFWNATSLTSLDVSDWDTGALENASAMFAGMTALTTLDVSGWNTEVLQDAFRMFGDVSSLTTLDVGSWTTGALTSAAQMFQGMSSVAALDVSGWNTENLIQTREMFHGVSSVTSLDMSGWKTSKFEVMGGMFADMTSLETIDVSTWDTTGFASVNEMFAGLSSLTELDLSGWSDLGVSPLGKSVDQTDMFARTPLRSLTIPNHMLLADESALGSPLQDEDFTGKWDVSGDWEGTTEELITRTQSRERDDNTETYLWQRHATLTLNPNGGAGDPITIQSTANKKFTLTESTFKLLNAKLASWNMLANGAGKSYAIGDTFVLPAGATTLYAQWQDVPVKPVIDPPTEPVKPIKPVDPTTTVTDGSKLARTGSEPMLVGIASAAVLVAGGAIVFLLRRRTRNS